MARASAGRTLGSARLPWLRRTRTLAIALAAVGGASGCDILEPYFTAVRNDLPIPVTVAACASYSCSRTALASSLASGQTTSLGAEPQGGYYSWIVFGPTGRPIGCLPFKFSRRPTTDLSVDVSEAVPCGSSGGVAATRGRDWPNPSF
jgi:hypothetical protein